MFLRKFVNRAQNLSKNFKTFWSFHPERERQRETERDRKREREIHLHSMDERLKEI